jgi:hypothetical protein
MRATSEQMFAFVKPMIAAGGTSRFFSGFLSLKCHFFSTSFSSSYVQVGHGV